VAKVSHELRSPLSTIHEQLALVLRDHVGNGFEDDQHILARAKEKTQGLISLIGDLLDLSRIEAGIICQEPKPVRIEKLLGNITDFLASKARGKDQALILDIRENFLPPVMADPIALESVFGNLITNAINYTPQGGEIRIMAELVDGKKMSVAVQDNGFGMEAAHLDKIFDKFFRIKNDKTRYITGTGLGLSIVKGLLDSLNGSISVQSAPDRGSTFKVLLPVQD
jgi:signal transduction histidine kinase